MPGDYFKAAYPSGRIAKADCPGERLALGAETLASGPEKRASAAPVQRKTLGVRVFAVAANSGLKLDFAGEPVLRPAGRVGLESQGSEPFQALRQSLIEAVH